MDTLPWLSIVMPVLDEGAGLHSALQALSSWRRSGAELIVVDGGSRDNSLQLAIDLADLALTAPRGRAAQMNAGAARARGRWLLFLHADTRLPDAGLDALSRLDPAAAWGRFDVHIDDPHPVLRMVSFMINLRSRCTGVATGDQALFARRDLFERVGGFPDIALMEDIALSRRLKAVAWPVCLRPPVLTSPRRWLQHGIGRTIWLMWRLRAAYFFGADPDDLARRYGYRPRER
jgi:rSAM/selenodomain-associated transferase 2